MEAAAKIKIRKLHSTQVFFGLYFVNCRSWQAEILQEHAEGCIQVDFHVFGFCRVVLYYDCLNGPIRLIYSRLINSTFT